MSNPWSQAYEDLRKPYLEGKMAKKDYDGDGKIESGKDEFMGSKDKAIKKNMGKKVAKEHHQKDADGKVIEHEDTTPSSVEEEQITELSKKTLGGYVKKASKETRGNMVATQHGSGIPKKARDIKLKQVNKRLKGMEKAGAKMAKEENVDEMITLTKGDYASRNVAGSAYSNAAKKKFDSKIYKAGGGLGSNFLPLANSHEPEGDVINELSKKTLISYTHKALKDKKFLDKARKAVGDYPAITKKIDKRNKGMNSAIKKMKKESFSDWRSDFIWEDGDSVKKT